MRRYLLSLLEHEYAALFCRGIWAEVTVTLTITDGTLRDDLDIYVCRHHRHEAGG
jgi:hypothetical protein